MDEMLDMCREKLVRSQIRFKTSCNPEHLSLVCRGSQIAQALLNLVHNACDQLEKVNRVALEEQRWILIEGPTRLATEP